MNKSNYVTLSGTIVKNAIKNDLIKEGKLGLILYQIIFFL